MSDDPDDNYNKARDLAEKALEEAAAGNDEKAQQLADEARALDPDAVQDVSDELAEEAESVGNPEQIKEDLGRDAYKQ
jgi:vacuolar-type H+-ATPase subunit H